MPKGLSISLLGPLEVKIDDKPLVEFEYNKVRALLAYLAVESGGPQTRAKLCALLWPDLPENAARQNLSQALSQLRRVLGDKGAPVPFLLATLENVWLNPVAAWDVDVTRFISLIADAEAHTHPGWQVCSSCSQKLSQAVALYRGDFLAQFYLGDSAPFEDWARPLRERLRQRLLSALERLGQYAEWRGAYEQAVEIAWRYVDSEPLRDESQRELMRLLALSGQYAAALAQYEYFRQSLAAELDLEPELETSALYAKIRAGGSLERFRRYQPPPNHLPALPAPFVGRETDLRNLVGMLGGGARLLTLTGAPGVGKTRLALEAARRLRYDFLDGVHFLELSPVGDAAQVPSAFAQVLGVKEQPGRTLEELIQSFLQSKHILLILDNFEHVTGAAPFIARLLSAAPGLKLLVTSRSSLHLRGERQYALQPLAEAEAVRLFSERVQAVRSAFRLTAENRETIAALCRHLDNLPLGIELVAVRARTFSPGYLLKQLEKGLEPLAGSVRDLPERQTSLREAIAWSYLRLTGDERCLFACLGVFAGGCTVDAAQAMVGATGVELSKPVPVLLETLVESSLVQAQVTPVETRFTLLDTIREYALEELAAQGKIEAIQRRHAEFLLSTVELAGPELFGPDQKAWFERLSRELSDLRLALAWSQVHDIELNARLAVALDEFWIVRGLSLEGRRWLKDALRLGENLSTRTRARTLMVAGRLAWKQGDLKDAQALLLASQQAFRKTEDLGGLALALYNLAMVYTRQSDYAAALKYFHESLGITRRTGDTFAEAVTLNGLAEVAMRQGDLAQDKVYTEAALALHRARHDPRNSARLTLNLSETEIEQGDYQAALKYAESVLTIAREMEDPDLITVSLLSVGNALMGMGRLNEARAFLEEAVVIHRSIGDTGVALSISLSALGRVLYKIGNLHAARRSHNEALKLHAESGDHQGVAYTLETLALVDHAEGHSMRAVRLLGAAASIRESIGAPISLGLRGENDELLAALHQALDEGVFATTWLGGRAMAENQAVNLALESEDPQFL